MDYLGVVGVFIGLAGLGFSIYSWWRRRRERLHRQQRFEWNHLYQGVRQICLWIERDGFKPELFLGIPGAGIILTELAVILLDEFLPIYMIQQKPRDSKAHFDLSGGSEVTTSKWRYWIPADFLNMKDKRVLILDDYAPTGDTLSKVKSFLLTKGFKEENVKTAALISLRSTRESGKNPDYIWFWVDTHDVHMPWGHASKRVRMGLIEQT